MQLFLAISDHSVIKFGKILDFGPVYSITYRYPAKRLRKLLGCQYAEKNLKNPIFSWFFGILAVLAHLWPLGGISIRYAKDETKISMTAKFDEDMMKNGCVVL